MPLDFFEEYDAMLNGLRNAIDVVFEASNNIGDPYGSRDNPNPEDYDIMEKWSNELAVLGYKLSDILKDIK